MLSSTGNPETICCLTLTQQFSFLLSEGSLADLADGPHPFQRIGTKEIPWFSFGVSGGVLSYRPDCLLELICTA